MSPIIDTAENLSIGVTAVCTLEHRRENYSKSWLSAAQSAPGVAVLSHAMTA